MVDALEEGMRTAHTLPQMVPVGGVAISRLRPACVYVYMYVCMYVCMCVGMRAAHRHVYTDGGPGPGQSDGHIHLGLRIHERLLLEDLVQSCVRGKCRTPPSREGATGSAPAVAREVAGPALHGQELKGTSAAAARTPAVAGAPRSTREIVTRKVGEVEMGA